MEEMMIEEMDTQYVFFDRKCNLKPTIGPEESKESHQR